MKDKLKKITEKMLIITGVCAAVSIMGTVGGIDCETMTLSQGVRQLLVAGSFLVFACGGYYILDF